MREAANAIIHLDKLGEAWCAAMHDSPMWPIHGTYQCRTCGRQYPVPWSAEQWPRNTVGHAAALRPEVAAGVPGRAS